MTSAFNGTTLHDIFLLILPILSQKMFLKKQQNTVRNSKTTEIFFIRHMMTDLVDAQTETNEPVRSCNHDATLSFKKF